MSNKFASLYSNDLAVNNLDLYMTTCNDVNMELALVHVGYAAQVMVHFFHF